jgi:hypothetical protein
MDDGTDFDNQMEMSKGIMEDMRGSVLISAVN